MATSAILEKGLELLSVFTKHAGPISISELSTSANLSTSTIYRYLATLRAQGYIKADTKPGHYLLGLKILELAGAIKRETSISLALPVMENLASQTGESVLLCARWGEKGMCLEKIEGRHNLRVSYMYGVPFYLHAGATGKVLLAYLDDEEAEQVIRKVGLPAFTENTVTDPEQLKADLREIKRAGFALSTSEMHEGAIAIAAPIFNRRGRVETDLSIGIPVHRFAQCDKANVIDLVVSGAKEISEKLKLYDI